MKPQDTSPSPTDKFWIKKYTRRVNGEQKYFVALEDFDGLAKQNEQLRAEKERLERDIQEDAQIALDTIEALVQGKLITNLDYVIDTFRSVLKGVDSKQQPETK